MRHISSSPSFPAAMAGRGRPRADVYLTFLVLGSASTPLRCKLVSGSLSSHVSTHVHSRSSLSPPHSSRTRQMLERPHCCSVLRRVHLTRATSQPSESITNPSLSSPKADLSALPFGLYLHSTGYFFHCVHVTNPRSLLQFLLFF